MLQQQQRPQQILQQTQQYQTQQPQQQQQQTQQRLMQPQLIGVQSQQQPQTTYAYPTAPVSNQSGVVRMQQQQFTVQRVTTVQQHRPGNQGVQQGVQQTTDQSRQQYQVFAQQQVQTKAAPIQQQPQQQQQQRTGMGMIFQNPQPTQGASSIVMYDPASQQMQQAQPSRLIPQQQQQLPPAAIPPSQPILAAPHPPSSRIMGPFGNKHDTEARGIFNRCVAPSGRDATSPSGSTDNNNANSPADTAAAAAATPAAPATTTATNSNNNNNNNTDSNDINSNNGGAIPQELPPLQSTAQPDAPSPSSEQPPQTSATWTGSAE
eukprot:Rhum_TRINITY_DN14795_c17_g2::Rhum_TRINITY_DN14795_c17_g2_i1::g.118357::m.118357